MLQRATTAQVVQTDHSWMLLVLLAATLFGRAAAFDAVERWPDQSASIVDLRDGWRNGPDCLLFGLLRLAVLTVDLFAVLIALSVVQR